MARQGTLATVLEPMTTLANYDEYVEQERRKVRDGERSHTTAAVNLSIGYPLVALVYTVGRAINQTGLALGLVEDPNVEGDDGVSQT